MYILYWIKLDKLMYIEIEYDFSMFKFKTCMYTMVTNYSVLQLQSDYVIHYN